MYRYWHSVTRPLLKSLQPVSVVEIGVGEGKHTELLLPYAQQHSVTLHCIDPIRLNNADKWKKEYGEIVRLYERPSLEVLPTIDWYDVVLIDGDHNWYTVLEELRIIERFAKKSGQFPLILIHDVGWPYARRDAYADPTRIPTAFLQPYAAGGVSLSDDQLCPDGINALHHHARTSGGSRNGVRTAVEDFLKETSQDLLFYSMEGLHGLGILVSRTHVQGNEMLAKHLGEIQSSPLIDAHVMSTEENRLQILAEKERLQHGNSHLLDILKRSDTYIQNLENENEHLKTTLKRVYETKSWRWTKFFRKPTDLPFVQWIRHSDKRLRRSVQNTAVELPQAMLFLALSGREWAWPITAEFLEKQTYQHDRMHLVIMDTSHNPAFSTRIKQWLETCDYAEHSYIHQIVGPKDLADRPREEVEQQMSGACATIYKHFAHLCIAPIACILEDDVLPPLNAFERLSSYLALGVVSVSGIYRHRHIPRLVAWEWDKKGFPHPYEHMQRDITSVGGNGFGCVVIDGTYFRNAEITSGPPLKNFDHNFYHQAVYTVGKTALIDWDCRCKHYLHADHWVMPL